MNKKGSWMALFLALPMVAWAGTVTTPDEAGLRLLVDQKQVEVGGTVKVSIEFRHIGNESTALGSPSIPTPEKLQMGGFTSSFTNVSYVDGKEMVTSTTQFSLTASQPGEETLGPALLIYQNNGGKRIELKSNQVALTIVPKSVFSIFGKKKAETPPTPVPAAAPDALNDLKPLMPESNWLPRVLVWGLAGLLALGLVLWRFWGTKSPAAASEPPLGRATQMRDRLKKLGNEDLDAKAFCSGLSALAREGLQYRFGFPAVNLTTEEILKALAKAKSTEDERVAAEKVLKTCDRVLHADGNMTGRDNLRALCATLLPKVPKG